MYVVDLGQCLRSCTRLLDLDSTQLTCFLFGWVSHESTQISCRAGESRLKLSKVARRGSSSGSRSILSQDSPKYLEGDGYFRMGIVRKATRGPMANSRAAGLLLHERKYLDEVSS